MNDLVETDADDEGLWTPARAAAYAGLTPNQLYRLRVSGGGPAFIVIAPQQNSLPPERRQGVGGQREFSSMAEYYASAPVRAAAADRQRKAAVKARATRWPRSGAGRWARAEDSRAKKKEPAADEAGAPKSTRTSHHRLGSRNESQVRFYRRNRGGANCSTSTRVVDIVREAGRPLPSPSRPTRPSSTSVERPPFLRMNGPSGTTLLSRRFWTRRHRSVATRRMRSTTRLSMSTEPSECSTETRIFDFWPS